LFSLFYFLVIKWKFSKLTGIHFCKAFNFSPVLNAPQFKTIFATFCHCLVSGFLKSSLASNILKILLQLTEAVLMKYCFPHDIWNPPSAAVRKCSHYLKTDAFLALTDPLFRLCLFHWLLKRIFNSTKTLKIYKIKSNSEDYLKGVKSLGWNLENLRQQCRQLAGNQALEAHAELPVQLIWN
jgi:hypothetical protein